MALLRSPYAVPLPHSTDNRTCQLVDHITLSLPHCSLSFPVFLFLHSRPRVNGVVKCPVAMSCCPEGDLGGAFGWFRRLRHGRDAVDLHRMCDDVSRRCAVPSKGSVPAPEKPHYAWTDGARLWHWQIGTGRLDGAASKAKAQHGTDHHFAQLWQHFNHVLVGVPSRRQNAVDWSRVKRCVHPDEIDRWPTRCWI